MGSSSRWRRSRPRPRAFLPGGINEEGPDHEIGLALYRDVFRTAHHRVWPERQTARATGQSHRQPETCCLAHEDLRRPAARRVGQCHRRDRPTYLSGAGTGDQSLTGEDSLAFFDAIAPIVHFDSIDMGQAWFQSRYDKVGPGGTGADYINCPLDRDQYEAFIDALLAAEKTEFKEWEGTSYFDGCLPIEVMAERGRETLRWGPMKPSA